MKTLKQILKEANNDIPEFNDILEFYDYIKDNKNQFSTGFKEQIINKIYQSDKNEIRYVDAFANDGTSNKDHMSWLISALKPNGHYGKLIKKEFPDVELQISDAKIIEVGFVDNRYNKYKTDLGSTFNGNTVGDVKLELK